MASSRPLCLQVHFDMLRRNSGRNSDFLELLSAVPGHPQQQGAAQQSFPRSVNPNTPASALPFVPSLPPAGTLFSNPLHEQVVTSVAASRDFTLVATAEGEVWTFGCGKDHQLGTGNYVQTDPRPVSGRVARIVAENGGAVDVAAGEAFCLALARNGSVVMWGRHALEGLVCNSTRGLPGMVRIAAGRKHAVLSDGESIWHCTLGPSPQHPGFDKPTRLTWQVRVGGSQL
jgi:Regulator of chromosome condensation (RCC1) repeat